MYSIEFTESATKQLFKLEKDIQKRVANALDRIRIRPFNFIMKIVGSPYYRLRVGDYRVILDIRNEKMVIMVIYIGHRKSIYKKG